MGCLVTTMHPPGTNPYEETKPRRLDNATTTQTMEMGSELSKLVFEIQKQKRGQHKYYDGMRHLRHNTALDIAKDAPKHVGLTTFTTTSEAHKKQPHTRTTKLTTMPTVMTLSGRILRTPMSTPTLCYKWHRRKICGWRWKKASRRDHEDSTGEHPVRREPRLLPARSS